jgi:hypothetical protein
MSQCVLCAAEAVLDPSLTNEQNGARYGVSETSVRRHKAHLSPGGVSLFEGVPEHLVTSRGRTVRLADGSYEKITWQPNAMAVHEALSYEDSVKALARLKPIKVVDHKPSTLGKVLCASDLQIGKASQRGGGTDQTLERIGQSLHEFKRRLKRDKPAEAALIDGGDIIENIWNVSTQVGTNDRSVPEQIRLALAVFRQSINMLAPLVPHLKVVAVPSNHGQSRKGFKSPEGTTDADFGLMINQHLEEVYAERSDFAHVEFVRPEPLYETATFELAGTKLAVHHGHHGSNIYSHDKWWMGQDHGRMPGWDADILIMNHFHTFAILPSGDGRSIICTSSSDPGSDWWTNMKGESSRSGMTTFDVLDGQWYNPQII